MQTYDYYHIPTHPLKVVTILVGLSHIASSTMKKMEGKKKNEHITFTLYATGDLA